MRGGGAWATAGKPCRESRTQRTRPDSKTSCKSAAGLGVKGTPESASTLPSARTFPAQWQSCWLWAGWAGFSQQVFPERDNPETKAPWQQQTPKPNMRIISTEAKRAGYETAVFKFCEALSLPTLTSLHLETLNHGWQYLWGLRSREPEDAAGSGRHALLNSAEDVPGEPRRANNTSYCGTMDRVWK